MVHVRYISYLYCDYAIMTHSWVLTIHKDRIYWKNLSPWKQKNCLQKWDNKYKSPVYQKILEQNLLVYTYLHCVRSLLWLCHHNTLLITSCSWVLIIYKDRIYWKNLVENKEIVFKNGIISIQALCYMSQSKQAKVFT